MIKFDTLMENIAEELGGSFTPYDDYRSVLIIPVDQNRFQRVLCFVQSKAGYKSFNLESKVCDIRDDINYKELLVQNSMLYDAKFIIKDDYLLVGASSLLDSLTKDQIKNMILEVAMVADKWEFEFTGADIN